MTTATKNVNPAPRLSAGATRPSARFGTWLRARLQAYVAMNEEAFRVPERSIALDQSVR
ncbi:hypothetical protein [Sanguibacter sp. 25GB23B1]|uniref:hypothetical protein n=1 Tax=unclassified Sanguibacter TaxID=2645534 RepID=UPI0032AFBCDA